MTGLLSLNQTLIQKTYRNGFDCYVKYFSINKHINTDANGIKSRFSFPTKYDRDNYPEKYLFEKIIKNYRPEQWLLLFGRNCITANWIRDFAGDEGDSAYMEAQGFLENSQKRFESMFSSYLITLYNKKIKFSESIRGQTPLIFDELLHKRISVEFLVLIDAVSPFLKNCNSFMYQDQAKKIHKYSQLFCVNKVLLNDVIKSQCS